MPMQAQGRMELTARLSLPAQSKSRLSTRESFTDNGRGLRGTWDTCGSVSESGNLPLDQELLRCGECGQALIDELTGLPSRRRWNSDAVQAIILAQQHREPIALLLVDLDRFKGINDSYGHPAADSVLQAVASVLLDAVGTRGFVCRYGEYAGDEFLLLLPSVDCGGALAVAVEIQGSIRKLSVRTRSARTVTVAISDLTASIGVAAFFGTGQSAVGVEDLVLDADGALRDAKRSGRNRICVAGVEGAGLLRVDRSVV